MAEFNDDSTMVASSGVVDSTPVSLAILLLGCGALVWGLNAAGFRFYVGVGK